MKNASAATNAKNDVTGVDAAPDLRVDPQGDHASNGISMAIQKLIHRGGIALANASKKRLGILGVGPHGSMDFSAWDGAC